MIFSVLGIIAILIALVFIGFDFHKLKQIRVREDLRETAETIRKGADMFMITQYKPIAVVVVIVAVILSLFIEKYAGLTFAFGALMSSAACLLGMKGGTLANVRVTQTALNTGESQGLDKISEEEADAKHIAPDLGATTKVALRGGSIGLAVPAFGLLGLIVIYLIMGGVKIGATSSGIIPILTCNPTILRFSTYSLGCSIIAMFNRVAGGNFTKAADIASDITGKVKKHFNEDDRRIVSSILDFIGDLVNDLAGNFSDLLESFVATIVACFLIAMAINNGDQELLNATCYYPIALASGGLISCIVGLAYVLHHKSTNNPSRELNMATYISAALTVVFGGFFSWVIFRNQNLYANFKLGWASPWVSSLLGIISGIAIGKITEYYTDMKKDPVKKLAQMCKEGTAFGVIKGEAIGARSCLLPISVIGISLLVSGMISGIYGIAVASLGMLSFVGATVSIDAFGPIADNGGGFAENCHLPWFVRRITDWLDALGNTTAAIGKGFAIGSAAFATVSLIFSYVSSYSSAAEPILNIASFKVIVGAMIGAALIEFFSALLAENTVKGAYFLAEVNEKQLEDPDIAEGRKTPDYETATRITTKQAIKHMVIPSLIPLLASVICGFLFGPEFVGGLLIGATIIAIPRAIFMGNSGGAWDNAKKSIEAGEVEGCGKGSPAHDASVNCDTIGDEHKDVAATAYDIFIKLMAIASTVLAIAFAAYHIF